MKKNKTWYYLIDDIKTPEKRNSLVVAIKSVKYINSAKYDTVRHILIVDSPIDPEQDVIMACDIFGCSFRTSIEEKHI